jgi:hypothetical protein
MNSRIHGAGTALLLGIAALAGGCSKGAPQSLKDVKVPAGFTWNTSQSVQVTLAAGATAMPSGGALPVELQRTDGKVLFRGRVRADQALKLRLPMATKDKELVAIAHGPQGITRTTLQIKDAAASASF